MRRCNGWSRTGVLLIVLVACDDESPADAFGTSGEHRSLSLDADADREERNASAEVLDADELCDLDASAAETLDAQDGDTGPASDGGANDGPDRPVSTGTELILPSGRRVTIALGASGAITVLDAPAEVIEVDVSLRFANGNVGFIRASVGGFLSGCAPYYRAYERALAPGASSSARSLWRAQQPPLRLEAGGFVLSIRYGDALVAEVQAWAQAAGLSESPLEPPSQSELELVIASGAFETALREVQGAAASFLLIGANNLRLLNSHVCDLATERIRFGWAGEPVAVSAASLRQ